MCSVTRYRSLGDSRSNCIIFKKNRGIDLLKPHVNSRADSLEKTLMLGKTKERKMGQQRMKWLNSITDSMDMNLSQLQQTVENRGAGVLPSMGLQRWTCLRE